MPGASLGCRLSGVALVVLATSSCGPRHTLVAAYGATPLPRDQLVLLQLHSSGRGRTESPCESRLFRLEVNGVSYQKGCDTILQLAPGPQRVRVIPLPASGTQTRANPSVPITTTTTYFAAPQREASLSFVAEAGARYEVVHDRTWHVSDYHVRIRQQRPDRIVAEGTISWTCTSC